MSECDFLEIWQEYHKKLFSFIKTRVSSQEDAEDILQDVLLKTYNYCLEKNEINNLKAWLFTLAKNSIVDYHKRIFKNVGLYFEISYDQNEYFDFNDAIQYVVPILKLLPEKYAIPLQMSDIEGIDQKEIAFKLGLTLTNTKSRIQRGRIKLKSRFLECCDLYYSENGEIENLTIKPSCKNEIKSINIDAV
jgi:RNA polymerase sigma-70 factor (ECF subfamily)